MREEKNNIENVPEGLWEESGPLHLAKVECKASLSMGNRDSGPQKHQVPKSENTKNVKEYHSNASDQFRTVDYYKLFCFAQQKMLTNYPAAPSGFQN